MSDISLNNLNAAELQSQLVREQSALAKARFDLADRKLKRTSDIGTTRRTIARIKTKLAAESKAKR